MNSQKLALSLSALLFCLISLGGGYAVWSGVALNFVQPSMLNMVGLPDLDRPINISIEVTPEQQFQLATKITEITSILKEDPTLHDYWIELGGLYQVIGDNEGAALAWEYAGYLRPESHVPFNNLGFLYRYYLNDFARAEKNFLIASVNKPDLFVAYRELSDLYRYSFLEKSDLADDILLEGIEKNPESFDLLVYLGIYYRDMGEIDLALKYLKEALVVAPGNTVLAEEIRKLENQ
jgi:tetratricopeptide (TPR) repeat protein